MVYQERHGGLLGAACARRCVVWVPCNAHMLHMCAGTHTSVYAPCHGQGLCSHVGFSCAGDFLISALPLAPLIHGRGQDTWPYVRW